MKDPHPLQMPLVSGSTFAEAQLHIATTCHLHYNTI